MTLLVAHADTDVVARGDAGDRTALDLRIDAAKVVAALPASGGDAFVLLVFENDVYLFAAALLGASAAGFRVALPRDLRPSTITACLADPRVCCLLHDTNVGGHLRMQSIVEGGLVPPSDLCRELAINVLGPDCDGKVEVRPLDFDALVTLPRTLGIPAERGSTLTTVPPIEPRVLAATVLGPLLAGGSFVREIAATPADVFAALDRGAVDNLISAPAHLRSLGASQATIGGAIQRVFSVLGPLDVGSQAAFVAQHGLKIIQRGDAEASGSVSIDALGPVFGLPNVVDAAAVRGVNGDLFVAVSGEGLRSQDVLEVVPGAHVVVVTEIERDAFGTADEREVFRCFGLAGDGSTLTVALDLSSTEEDGETLRARVRIPEDYVYFDGHFDTYPILPGVAQLHEIVLPLCLRAKPDVGAVRQMQRLKFLGRIEPGDVVDVELRFSAEAAVCDFEINAGERRCSAGRLLFEAKEVSA